MVPQVIRSISKRSHSGSLGLLLTHKNSCSLLVKVGNMGIPQKLKPSLGNGLWSGNPCSCARKPAKSRIADQPTKKKGCLKGSQSKCSMSGCLMFDERLGHGTLPPIRMEPDLRGVLVWTMFFVKGPFPERQVPREKGGRAPWQMK